MSGRYLHDRMASFIRWVAIGFAVAMGIGLNAMLILALLRFLSKGMC